MKIAIVGTFQTGKSTLMNCLIDDCIANVGIGLPTTHMVNYYQSGSGKILCRNKEGICVRKATLEEFRLDPKVPINTTWIMHELPGKNCLEENIIIDTPGLDSHGVDASSDNLRTLDVIDRVDCIILLLPNTKLTEPMRKVVVNRLKTSRKPVVALMNCLPIGFNLQTADPKCAQNIMVAKEIDRDLAWEGLIPCDMGLPDKLRVVPCNVAWWWVSRAEELKDSFFDNQTREVFNLRMQEVVNVFRSLDLPVPRDSELREKSNLSVLINHLVDIQGMQTITRSNRDENNPTIDARSLRAQMAEKLSERFWSGRDVFH